ncbi:MazG nucleotide pyrophosphohydrolase domain-containing protein [Desulfuromonas thiophila]|uniref:MazG nucleotide pyrophosphohydrolase domain-containing protein n=1 Tax=Desulfuromonas thiophila TaxID=57664 RepID=UPI0029F5344C|nr:MazG nucleotide pyrophosphohydrolase domain-containing protein [Desulfuromonas thiophila]
MPFPPPQRNQTQQADPLLDRLRALIVQLRSPGGCPWDQRQDWQSLAPHLLEECYEVLQAIDLQNGPLLCEELGDVLMLLVFLAEIAAEQQLFDFDQVIEGICAKLIRRHPHVFEKSTALSDSELHRQWQQIKQSERQNVRPPPTAGTARPLPALLQAQRQLQPPAGADQASQLLAQLTERLSATARQPEQLDGPGYGALLAELVRCGQSLQLDAESCLRQHLARLATQGQIKEEKS